MNSNLDNLLCERYPKIFVNRNKSMKETAMCWGFDHGDGWFNIIDALCANIQHHIDWTEQNKQRVIKKNAMIVAARNGDWSLFDDYYKSFRVEDKEEYRQRTLEEILKDPPDACPQVVADQIKEKFGTLRFYYHGGDDKVDGMVQMAESMSAVTCEKCGKPGTTEGPGWITTLCEEHRNERNNM